MSVTKTESKKMEAMIRSAKLFASEFALCVNKSTIRPCMKYFCHVWAATTCSELAELVPLSYFRGRSIRYASRLLDFSINLFRCYKDGLVNSFLPLTAGF